ncbi:unnamed protein product [Rotaria socialis]|uniref:F-box domain-containing protein n=1 Tax=Rotaria socialis TaxID=392032 RepID=A0A820D490_9BILA|nr:unnamed protein product [Rotaria socialis]CAF4217916.1 unnamed protein product [Rotaria socialis]
MSNIISSKPSRLELLPNEILFEIFKYVKPIDLHRFVGCNQRFNNIISDVKLSVDIQYPGEEEEDEEDFNYLKRFHPNQFIRLELRCRWGAFNLHLFTELRSLKIDCNYLSENQFNQVLTANLPDLQRFSIDNVPNYYGKELLITILDSERFPSLTLCQFSGEFYYMLELNEHYTSPNSKIRTLILNRWDGSSLCSLLNLLPNLRRFETNFLESISKSLKFNMHYITLENLRITLNDPSNDLEKILSCMPNLKYLRVKGKIPDGSVLECFEKMAKTVGTYSSNLQKFDCELYFHAWIGQVDILVIQKLHPLFKMIECHFGKLINQCYATDLTEYPIFNEYAYVERMTHNTTLYSGVMGGYDSDNDYNNYDDNDYNNYDDNDYNSNNGWTDYGLGYRGNYKANYGSSPWSGNND